ncbi:hypothetical protein [Jiulongibacter sp. NS-SX5]|uniref:hypothetical protein n=1 Tax=Jiulongibacter sp. NS-SX5 TaxID=3463854 RepID=UPI0040580881
MIKILKEYYQHNIVLQAVGEISGIVKIRIGNKGNNTNYNPNGSRPPVNYTLGPGKIDTIVTFTETYNDEIFIYYSSLNSPKGLLKLGIYGTADIIPRKGNTGISKIEFCP